MRHLPRLLDQAHVATLNGFALSNVLLAFDYDGTLAPIADTPRAARMRDETRQLLARVAALYPCVVISGRALADLERRLDGIPLWSLVGNHGLESASQSGPPPQGDQWSALLRQRLPNVPGLSVEDKRHTITIHYRQVGDKVEICRAIHDAIADIPGIRVLAGIEAISLLPSDGRHKGTALQDARRQFACDTAIYAGDDETDEDAFRSSDSAELLSIRIGPSPHTAARFCLEDQTEIDPLLHALIKARDTGSTAAELRSGPR